MREEGGLGLRLRQTPGKFEGWVASESGWRFGLVYIYDREIRYDWGVSYPGGTLCLPDVPNLALKNVKLPKTGKETESVASAGGPRKARSVHETSCLKYFSELNSSPPSSRLSSWPHQGRKRIR